MRAIYLYDFSMDGVAEMSNGTLDLFIDMSNLGSKSGSEVLKAELSASNPYENLAMMIPAKVLKVVQKV